MATSGPGATNLITGIADAIIDCTPMVAVTGQVASNLLGTDAFQETDVIGITTPICKWNYQIIDPDEIPEVMAKAFYIARAGKPVLRLVKYEEETPYRKLGFAKGEISDLSDSAWEALDAKFNALFEKA